MKKPIIGIIGRVFKQDNDNLFTHDAYRLAIIKSGGMPLLILPPYSENIMNITPFSNNLSDIEKTDLLSILSFCDGFLFPGGTEWFGFEQFIFEYAYEQNKPVMGICLGMQMMACKKYFSLACSDYTKKIKSTINHYQLNNQVHSVSLKNSRLRQILKTNEIIVNSRHHDQIAFQDYFIVSAFSSDGVIEAIEFPEKKFIIGVQWHPEDLFFYDEHSRVLFQNFISSCL